MTDEHLAAEAERLLRDPVLLQAVADMKREAIDALIRADANEPIQVLRFQERARAASEILATLQRYIDALPEA